MNEVKFSERIIPDEWLGHFDMLRDRRRNFVYSKNIQLLASFYKIHNLSKDDKYWIDIGCGSGLLGCLVGKYLNMKVIAFECIPILAKIARQTILKNNLQEYVTVWLVHTSDLDSQFMQRTFGKKASYVVSELLDTTLLGEGLYEGLRHAYANLLSPDPRTPISSIPHYAKVFIQAWSGECISDRRNLSELSISRLGLQCPQEFTQCTPSSLSTIQWSHYRLHGAYPLTKPIEIFDFDFMNLSHSVSKITTFLQPMPEISLPVQINALLIFWGCCCCVTSSDFSECCSSFDSESVFHSRGDSDTLLTDHWRQSVLYLNSNDLSFKSSTDLLKVNCCHNEDDIWVENTEIVNVRTSTTGADTSVILTHPVDLVHPICTCGLHSSLSSFQMKEINSSPMIDWILEVVYFVGNYLDRSLSIDEGNFGIILMVTDHILCPTALAYHLQTHYNSQLEEKYLHKTIKFYFIYTSKRAFHASKLLFDCNISSPMVKEIITITNIDTEELDTTENDINQVDEEISESYWVTDIVNQIQQSSPQNKHLMNLHTLSGIPYLNDCHDEGVLHHILHLNHYYSDIIHECHHRAILSSDDISLIPLDNYSIEIFCGLFRSESLWMEYSGLISMVEGIDMSAINSLMKEIPSQDFEMKSIRLSQWNAEKLHSITSIGTISSSSLCPSQDQVLLWSQDTLLSISEGGLYHGIAIFTILQHSTINNSTFLSSNPQYYPDSLQYFRCFDKETYLENDTHLMITTKITSDHQLLISLH